MKKQSKKETIEVIDDWLEMICDDMGCAIEITDIPNFKYMIKQLVEETGSSEEKIIEGLKNWHSGIYRRNG
jgi:hypothetical protein